MRNFRGFDDAHIPLRRVNFLVGENSTGKSSLLSVLSAIANPHFVSQPNSVISGRLDEYFGGAHESNTFDDLVSASSADRSFFELGIFDTIDTIGNFRASLYRFCADDGSPKLCLYKLFIGNKLIEIDLSGSVAKYRIDECRTIARPAEDIRECLRRADSCSSKSKMKDSGVPSEAPLMIILNRVEQNLSFRGERDLPFGDPLLMHGRLLTSIAPIRSAPQRFYESISPGYSPEGRHTPVLLRRFLKSGSDSSKFAESLRAFGKASGLFETIFPHSFGDDPRAPFEIVVKLSAAEVGVKNVGYGVAQALPLIVEFLADEGRRDFSVQQPEVHLHPRAQAALGGLIYSVARTGKGFFVETHSDYLIDRFRISLSSDKARSKKPLAQVLFFSRSRDGRNNIFPIKISPDGSYPSDQPEEFREFFINEQIKLLGI